MIISLFSAPLELTGMLDRRRDGSGWLRLPAVCWEAGSAAYKASGWIPILLYLQSLGIFCTQLTKHCKNVFSLGFTPVSHHINFCFHCCLVKLVLTSFRVNIYCIWVEDKDWLSSPRTLRQSAWEKWTVSSTKFK